MTDTERINKALEIANNYAGCEGDHHRMWVIDQMVRALTRLKYKQWVRDFEDGEDGPKTYLWDTGIAP